MNFTLGVKNREGGGVEKFGVLEHHYNTHFLPHTKNLARPLGK